MLFNSLHFFIFFPIIVALYFTLSHKYRWILLLLGSYYFYMSWKAEYIILIVISTLVDYFSAIEISKSDTLKRKKIFLSLSLLVNLGLLFSFKYLNFFSDSLRLILQNFSIQLNPLTTKLLLPVGISFYTFQTISYTIDVYRGRVKPEKHLGIFAVYVSFFPQLVAGPIERAKNLIPQFYEKHQFKYKRVIDGLKLMLWGFFKKMVIADGLAVVVDIVYNNPSQYTGTPLILATIFFSFQLYCDFSGYVDIARGSAQVLGFKLMDNFRRPYSSKNISEFWRRWHISLSSWFQDYVFNPLYMKLSKLKSLSKLTQKRRHFVAFIISLLIGESILGLWHGANWTFILFGLYYGILISLYYIMRKHWNKIPLFLQIITTFVLVNIGWVFFRANNVSDIIYILTHLFTNLTWSIPDMRISLGWLRFIYLSGMILFLEFVHIIQAHKGMRQFLDDKPQFLRWTIYLIILLLLLLFGVYEKVQFIYFQF